MEKMYEVVLIGAENIDNHYIAKKLNENNIICSCISFSDVKHYFLDMKNCIGMVTVAILINSNVFTDEPEIALNYLTNNDDTKEIPVVMFGTSAYPAAKKYFANFGVPFYWERHSDWPDDICSRLIMLTTLRKKGVKFYYISK